MGARNACNVAGFGPCTRHIADEMDHGIATRDVVIELVQRLRPVGIKSSCM